MEDKAKINAIYNLDCKKHIKIYKLNQMGLTNKQIADVLMTNAGHVYNALKDYKDKPKKAEEANQILVP